jgi:RND family efflux transporter MFP subunit
MLVVMVLAAALTAGVWSKLTQTQRVNAAANEAVTAPPRVTVMPAHASTPSTEQELPGNALPLLEAGLYARATGYLKRRLVDIGDRVKEGELLAEISAPDIDDQLAQAQANLVQARANLVRARADEDFARSEERRYQKLVGTNAISREDYESKLQASRVSSALVSATEAAIKVNEAAVQRFEDLQRFEKIIAPFPGVITARHVDPGDLINADSTARELFHLMRIDIIRVMVNVPQVYAPGIRVGQQAVVFRREKPTEQFSGKVTRTANALEPNTRTLLTEVQVKNPKDTIHAGMYLRVKFVFDREIVPVMIPAAALVTRAEGQTVAVLDEENRVRYRKVQLGRDFGADLEVIVGVSAGERVVVHPGDDLPEGMVVEPLQLGGK